MAQRICVECMRLHCSFPGEREEHTQPLIQKAKCRTKHSGLPQSWKSVAECWSQALHLAVVVWLPLPGTPLLSHDRPKRALRHTAAAPQLVTALSLSCSHILARVSTEAFQLKNQSTQLLPSCNHRRRLQCPCRPLRQLGARQAALPETSFIPPSAT